MIRRLDRRAIDIRNDFKSVSSWRIAQVARRHIEPSPQRGDTEVRMDAQCVHGWFTGAWDQRSAGSTGAVAKFSGSVPVRLPRNATILRTSLSPAVTPS